MSQLKRAVKIRESVALDKRTVPQPKLIYLFLPMHCDSVFGHQDHFDPSSANDRSGWNNFSRNNDNRNNPESPAIFIEISRLTKSISRCIPELVQTKKSTIIYQESLVRRRLKVQSGWTHVDRRYESAQERRRY